MDATAPREVIYPKIVLALLSGALYAAALPPIGAWPLGWVTLAPICWVCAGATPRSGAGYGLVFGLTSASLTSPWLPGMVADYFQSSPLLVWPSTLAIWLLCGGAYHAIWGGWLAWATRRGPVSPLMVAASWWLLDWARANAWIANPWALLGYTQVGALPVAQIADLVGPYGIGALLAAAGATLAGFGAPGLHGANRRRSLIVVSALVASSLVYGAARLGEAPGHAAPVRVGLVQAAIPREHRYAAQHIDDSLTAHLDLTRRAARDGAELVLWPELALDFYMEREPEPRRHLLDSLAPLDVDLLTGGLGVLSRDGETTRSNSVFLIQAGAVQGRYDKVRLMVFSEMSPWPFGALRANPLAAGETIRPVAWRGVRMGLALCSEAMHPGFVREVVREGAEVLVTPSVDSWFGARGASRQQLEAVAMRAIETRRWIARPTATGLTAVIDPWGRIIAEAPADEPATIVASLRPRDDRSPYVRLGDVGVLLALAALLTDAIVRVRRRYERADVS